MGIGIVERTNEEKAEIFSFDDFPGGRFAEDKVQKEPQLISLTKEHSGQMAKLHIDGIRTGFISSLGIDFVTVLYEGVVENGKSFGIVTNEGKLLGFVSVSANIGKLYKSMIFKKGFVFAFLLARKMVSFGRIKKIFETLFYPCRTKKLNLPSTELLSIVVAPEACRLGYATKLGRKGIEEYQKQGVGVKVLVGAENEAANRLYRGLGFELVRQTSNHGVLSNIYVMGARTNAADQISESLSSNDCRNAKRMRYLAGRLKPVAAAIMFALVQLSAKLQS